MHCLEERNRETICKIKQNKTNKLLLNSQSKWLRRIITLSIITFSKSYFKDTTQVKCSTFTIFLFFPSTLFYSTLLYATLLYSTLLYSTLLYSTLLYSTLLYSTLLYSTLLYSTLLYSTLLYSTLLYSTLVYSSLL